MPAFSIPASEHSTMVSWTREKEREAYENMLGLSNGTCLQNIVHSIYFLYVDMYPKGTISCVSDSYNIFNACEHIWGEQLHDKVLARDGAIVIRSDSGMRLQKKTQRKIYSYSFIKF